MGRNAKLYRVGKRHRDDPEPMGTHRAGRFDPGLMSQSKSACPDFSGAVPEQSAPCAHHVQLRQHMSMMCHAVDDWCASKRLEDRGNDYHVELEQAQMSISQAVALFGASSGLQISAWPVFVSYPRFRHASRCAFYILEQFLPILHQEFKEPLLRSCGDATPGSVGFVRLRYRLDLGTFLSALDFIQAMIDEIRRQTDRTRFH